MLHGSSVHRFEEVSYHIKHSCRQKEGNGQTKYNNVKAVYVSIKCTHLVL